MVVVLTLFGISGWVLLLKERRRADLLEEEMHMLFEKYLLETMIGEESNEKNDENV